MASVTPKILQLNPPEDIIIYLTPDHVHGISEVLTLGVMCTIVPNTNPRVHLTLQLLDTKLFLFANSQSTLDFYYDAVPSNKVLTPSFRIINRDALTGLPVRIRVITNDVTEPYDVMGDFKQFGVHSTTGHPLI